MRKKIKRGLALLFASVLLIRVFNNDVMPILAYDSENEEELVETEILEEEFESFDGEGQTLDILSLVNLLTLDEDGEDPEAEVTTPAEDEENPEAEITTPAEDEENPEAEITTPAEDEENPEAEITTPAEDEENPEAEITTPAEDEENPEAEVTTPAEDTEDPEETLIPQEPVARDKKVGFFVLNRYELQNILNEVNGSTHTDNETFRYVKAGLVKGTTFESIIDGAHGDMNAIASSLRSPYFTVTIPASEYNMDSIAETLGVNKIYGENGKETKVETIVGSKVNNLATYFAELNESGVATGNIVYAYGDMIDWYVLKNVNDPNDIWHCDGFYARAKVYVADQYKTAFDTSIIVDADDVSAVVGSRIDSSVVNEVLPGSLVIVEIKYYDENDNLVEDISTPGNYTAVATVKYVYNQVSDNFYYNFYYDSNSFNVAFPVVVNAGNDNPTPGPGDDDEPTPGPGDDDEPTPGPGDDDEPTPGPGDDDEPTPGPGDDDDPTPGPGDDDNPTPGPGDDDDPTPGPGDDDEPTPGPGDDDDPTPGPGDDDDPTPGPGDDDEPTPGPGDDDEPTPGPGDDDEPTPGPGDDDEPTPGPGDDDEPTPDPGENINPVPGPGTNVNPVPAPNESVNPEPTPVGGETEPTPALVVANPTPAPVNVDTPVNVNEPVDVVIDEPALIDDSQESVDAPESVDLSDGITPLADGLDIDDNDTPLASMEDDGCWIHWLIAIMTLIYAAYAGVMGYNNNKKIKNYGKEDNKNA